MIVKIYEYAGSFAEDKDVAKMIREQYVMLAISTNQPITLDFDGVQSSTQSFIHALISKAFQDNGEKVLGQITFANCSEKVRGLIAMVTNYSLE